MRDMTIEEKQNLINKNCREYLLDVINKDLAKYFWLPTDWIKPKVISVDIGITLSEEMLENKKIKFTNQLASCKWLREWKGTPKFELSTFKVDISFDAEGNVISESVNISQSNPTDFSEMQR